MQAPKASTASAWRWRRSAAPASIELGPQARGLQGDGAVERVGGRFEVAVAEQAAAEGVEFPRRARDDAIGLRPSLPHAGRWPRRGSAAPAITPARDPNRPPPWPASAAPRGAPRESRPPRRARRAGPPRVWPGRADRRGGDPAPPRPHQSPVAVRSGLAGAPELREANLELPGDVRSRRAGRVEEARRDPRGRGAGRPAPPGGSVPSRRSAGP